MDRVSQTKRARPPVWAPTAATSIALGDCRMMHAGPAAMWIPEHEHAEVQVQTRFERADGEAVLRPLGSSLYAPGQPHTGGIEENWEVIVVLLGPNLMARAAGELFSRDRVEIKPFHLVRAPMLEHLHRAVREEFQSSLGASRLYLESIAQVLAGQILRGHADTANRRRIQGRLSPGQMSQIDRFIHDHIGSDFGVEDLAGCVKLGPQRFSERFRLTTGVPPWRYVLTRRLEQAQQLLTSSRLPLAEIALGLGFCSQSHFANAFKRAFGVTARTYRDLR
jgi:AraC family transcriptional regulator